MSVLTPEMIERVAIARLDRRGFCFSTDPMEAGQDAYDISMDALSEAENILKALLDGISVFVPEDDPSGYRIRVKGATDWAVLASNHILVSTAISNPSQYEVEPLYAAKQPKVITEGLRSGCCSDNI